jgi:predicted ATP-dependent serine protease
MVAIQSLKDITVPDWMNESISSGIKVLDELINGEGLHPGQVVTISASRGVGKTTLLLQMLGGIANTNSHLSVLYVSREEPSFQLKKTAQRIGIDSDINIIGDESELSMEEFIKFLPSYGVVVLDSFSLIHMENSTDGSKMKLLKDAAKEHRCALIIVLHNTKSGTSKGSSDIEHLCDSVVDIERGDPEVFGNTSTRIIEVSKNRFGNCGQVILNLERNGWDFDNPVEAKSINDDNKNENRNSPQAKKPFEMSAIMNIVKEKNRISFSDLHAIIPTDDSAAVGRFTRHMKELEKHGKLIKIGKGNQSEWEFVS